MTTKVIKCKCDHEYQDKIYGKSMRLANKTDKSSNKEKPSYRCTVCGSQA